MNNGRSQSPLGLPIKWIATAILAFALLIVVIVVGVNTVGRNDVANWQVKQGWDGSIEIIDEPGYYWKPLAKIWTYPRSIQTFYDDDQKNKKDETIGVTFNDGGTAKISSMVRLAMPTTKDERLQLHRTFGNGNDCQNVTDAAWAHLVNVLKNSAPLMSASENQAGRKAEFNQVVEEQLRGGLYQMKIISKKAKDQTDQGGNEITVYSTELSLGSNGVPMLAQESPLASYGISITQFSVTDTLYDEQTLKQFSAKKESFLAAEKSKAEREQEVQLRLMTVEKGLREKAEVEAIANKQKATATIEAQQKVEVAAKTKEEAETKANQQLSVAKIEKEQALTKANQLLEVSVINARAAEADAKGIITLAEAQAKKISLAGAITEKDRTLAEIQKERDIGVAQYLSQIRTPSIIMAGGAGDGAAGGGMQNNLLNILLLKAAGIEVRQSEPDRPSPFAPSKD